MKNASNLPGKLWKQLWKRAAKKLLPKKTGKILDFLSKPAIIGGSTGKGVRADGHCQPQQGAYRP